MHYQGFVQQISPFWLYQMLRNNGPFTTRLLHSESVLQKALSPLHHWSRLWPAAVCGTCGTCGAARPVPSRRCLTRAKGAYLKAQLANGSARNALSACPLNVQKPPWHVRLNPFKMTRYSDNTPGTSSLSSAFLVADCWRLLHRV